MEFQVPLLSQKILRKGLKKVNGQKQEVEILRTIPSKIYYVTT